VLGGRFSHSLLRLEVDNGIWLGADQKNYTAHIARFTLAYRFK
jgi:hypothetical protein